MKKLILVLMIVLLFSKDLTKGKPSDVYIDNTLVRSYLRQLNALTPEQTNWLKYIYRRCMNYGLENTCVAVAWEESQFGVYKVIPWSGDYGLMGINLYWYIKDNNYNYRNKYLRSRLATKLTCDNDYNIMYAITKLEKLKNKYKSWKTIWAHYNGGTYPNWYYAKRILNKIRAFRIFLRKNNL